MNFEDFLIPLKPLTNEEWQLGSMLEDEVPEGGIALLFVSDYRGSGGLGETQDFTPLRKQLYKLSRLDFEVPVYDFGDLISGNSMLDTHYVLQEILSLCHYKKTVPVVVGGSNSLSFSLFSALNFHQKNISYTQISNVVSLSGEGEQITEKNFLNRIFSSKNFSIKNYHHLGYQKHLNSVDNIKMIKQVEFDVVRLAEMMGSTHKTEPFLRHANLVTVNCDAVESFADAFSVHPQVNGLNRREICAYMKEVGLSQNLQSAGIFNLNLETENVLNQQLTAQMIWHLIEGINIQKSHPKEKKYETYWLLIDDQEYAFKRDTFSGLWYFGADENVENCLPCSQVEYEEAKRGQLNSRLFRYIK